MILGAHVSIARGVSNAPLHAKRIGCETFQIFTKNQMQWKIPNLSEEEINKFKHNLLETGVIQGTVYSSYLVNLASPDEKTHSRSINDLAVDLERAEKLGIRYLVFHPGAHKGKGEKYALKKISKSIDKVFQRSSSKESMLLLETTAGEGTNVGYLLEHLDYIIQHVKNPERVGICIDTCHIFAAGYDIRTLKAYNRFIKKIKLTFGLEKIKAFHLNDSKKELGSKMDRHEEIGKGRIGIKAFEMLVNDKNFINIPGILETPGGDAAYKENINILKNLRR